eukprot:gnl/TRDRNA2_/TRDRNA2_151774_c0_seq2.p1 gnl/TRDRNA2_/TRDRNA2_151774_c0~~gnl/TRDRNA2_/TRDRNA2_151774_c0_seq2.p1  ORF type:complete len:132 (+),score=22.76 gnl/TRDRNA2_/TRDRNA2_151774_c0_seq2:77-472(+)
MLTRARSAARRAIGGPRWKSYTSGYFSRLSAAAAARLLGNNPSSSDSQRPSPDASPRAQSAVAAAARAAANATATASQPTVLAQRWSDSDSCGRLGDLPAEAFQRACVERRDPEAAEPRAALVELSRQEKT